jgi:8-oxo-dGTP diphosphatase
MAMTTIDRAAPTRQMYFHDPAAPPATVVAPSVVVAVRWRGGRLLLVRRRDSGCWELPGGPIEVGETAVEAAVRRTAHDAGVRVLITELAGLFTDPGLVERSPGGEVRQPFTVLFRARWLGGVPCPDHAGTSDAAWVALADLPRLAMEPSARSAIAAALAAGEPPCLD